ncbi:MAG: translation initiation factor IF-2 [Candidatus Aminicenantes bacterium]|nr:translation initiation factor IF-2 [Candidatus Aminicenantes bacterium]
MATIKLHEATKQFEIANKLAMYFLEKVKLPVKSHSSVISVDQLELLREFAASPAKVKALEAEMKKGPAAKRTAAAPTTPTPAVQAKKKKVEAAAPPPAEVKRPIVEKKQAAVEKKPPAKKVIEKKTVEKKGTEKKPVEPPPVPEKKAATVEPVAKPVKAHEPGPKKIEAEIKKPIRPQPELRRPFKPAAGSYRKPQNQYQRRRHEPAAPKYHPEKKEKPAVEVILPESIQITDFCTMKELAEKLTLKLKPLEEKVAQLKMNYHGNQTIDRTDIEKLCAEFAVAVEILPYEDYVFQSYVAKTGSQLLPRPPIVTVMGHVDHGKTTLLDTLRKTRVAEKEAGGITQKIGAYKLQNNEDTIVFIDTPGHEAFTNLRARGAKVTDLVILIVAANDGVQPQTVEAINHAQAAKVPMIVAINKIDIQGADSEKIKQELNKHNVLVESWGGKVVSIEISAKLNQNLDALLEMVQLVAQMQELKAYVQVPARGTIIESRLDPQLGPIGTVLIQHGQLKKGDFFICGSNLGKIKSIFADSGKMLDEARVPDPVEIMGFDALPEAGDVFQVIDDLEKAKKVIEMRQISLKAAKSKDFLAEKRLSLQNLFQMVEQNVIQVFPVIVKADNFGSAEVLGLTLDRLSQEKLKIEILHSGLGNITESDILLASTAGAVILGFNVKAPQKIMALAQQSKVEIKLYNVIYHLVEDIEKAVKGKIGPEYQETLIGKVEILQKFKISKVGIVAGCIVREGKVTRKSKIKVMRGSDLVFEGEIESLKRIKDEVSEVRAGTECGIRIKNFNNIEIGDSLEIYETQIIS